MTSCARPNVSSILHRFALGVFLVTSLWAQDPQVCRVELFVGDPVLSNGDGDLATTAKLLAPASLAVEPDGSVYFADTNQIKKIDAAGILSTVAGSGVPGHLGDGGFAVDAQLFGPAHLSRAPNGTLYFSDGPRRIRRITPSGIIETVYSSSGLRVTGISVSAAGEVYFTEAGDGVFSGKPKGLYRLESDGSKVAIVDGTSQPGDSTMDAVPALDYRFENPAGLFVASNGDILVIDRARILTVGQDNVIRVTIGGAGGSFQDGSLLLQTSLRFPNRIAQDAAGDVFISDSDRGFLVARNGAVNRISTASVFGLAASDSRVVFSRSGQVFQLLAGDTTQVLAGIDRSGSYAPGMAFSETHVEGPRRMKFDSVGRLYFFNANRTIVYRTTLDNKLEIIAGGGDEPADDGILATQARFGIVGDIALDGSDRLYISSSAGFGRPSMLLRVEPSGLLTVLAGEGQETDPISSPQFPAIDLNLAARTPLLAVTPEGVVYFNWRSRIYEIGLDGIARVVLSPNGDPLFLATDPMGRLLVGDFDGLYVYENVSSPPTRPFGSQVTQAAAYSNGAYFILRSPNTVVRVSPAGRLTDFFPFGAGFDYSTGQLALNSSLPAPSAIAVNQVGDLFVADSSLDRIFVIRNAAVCLEERPYIGAIVNGASFNTSGFSPGELVSVFGDYLGPASLAYGAPGQSDQGTWQDNVGGLEVLVNGYKAPIVFSRQDQAAFVIPNEVSGIAEVQIRRNGFLSGVWSREVAKAAPGLFTVDSSGGGQAAALNEDTSINSPSNRAAPGSVIVLYLTGGGLTNPPSQTGSLNDAPLPQLIENVEVLINWQPAVIEYAGPAPGLISGVIQMNARIPANTPSGTDIPVVVKIGGIQSEASPSNIYSTISIQ